MAFDLWFYGVHEGEPGAIFRTSPASVSCSRVGWPIIIAPHLTPVEFRMALMWAGTLISIALCAIAVYGLTRFLLLPPAPAVAR